ncbi:hypothetical protein LWC34_33580 [Kibdelosporangium philippinense]|uniref:Ketohydroxyglutarate aldolase n=1 Tax=Kibdelosporangium philippinense TaxID=211113 RepID=A0ABS8ZJ02_9PSEU|nr:hypothetical protein [Kibdelosporangium philippinense]MCE7007715.1 hypothetical protein [Kibdelosporangium philippinense]
MPKIMVSIEDESMTDMPRLVEDLRRAGLLVDEVFEALGTVTGSIAPEAVDTLMAVPGVAAVEWQRDNYCPADPSL